MNAKVWSRYEEPKEEVVQENEVLERKISYKTVVVTEVTPEMHFYAQNTETGTKLLYPHLCRLSLLDLTDLHGRRALRSASSSRLVVLMFRLSTVGSRTFNVSGPRICSVLCCV